MAASNDSSSTPVDPKPDLKVVDTGVSGEASTESAATGSAAAEPEATLGEAPSSSPSPSPASASSPPPAPADRVRPLPGPSSSEPSRSRLPWLLGVAFVFAVIFALWQGQRVDRLATEVERLETELSVAGAELQAHRAHLSRVRVGIDDLTSRAQSLSDLAHADPSASTSAPAPAPAAAQSTIDTPSDVGAGRGASTPVGETDPGSVDF